MVHVCVYITITIKVREGYFVLSRLMGFTTIVAPPGKRNHLQLPVCLHVMVPVVDKGQALSHGQTLFYCLDNGFLHQVKTGSQTDVHVICVHVTFYEYIHTYIPYLTLPYLTLPYLTLPYITLHTYINHCMYIHAIVCGIYIYTFLRICASTRVTGDTWDPISPSVGNTVWAAASNRTPPRSRCCTKATQATRKCFKGGNGKSSLEIH